MARQITQEAFDDMVQKNVEDFECPIEEAIEETIAQLKAQHVNLSNISTHNMAPGHDKTQLLKETIDLLKCLVTKNAEPMVVYDQVEILQKEMIKHQSSKLVAGSHGAYQVLMDVMEKYESDINIIKICLQTFGKLMSKQPDLLDSNGILLMIKVLSNHQDKDVLVYCLRWMRECCVLSEKNRQLFFEHDILDHLAPLLSESHPSIIRHIFGVLRNLVLDDDVRVEFGKAPEYARIIATKLLWKIMDIFDEYKENEEVLNEILQTLISLLVRAEFCKRVDELRGLDMLKEAMTRFDNNERLIKNAMRTIKALAGDDEVKSRLIRCGYSPVIVQAIHRHHGSPGVVTYGLACVAALTLRSAENSKIFFEDGAPEMIADAMTLHPEDGNVQRHGSWAIRNMVSRSRYQSPKFLELGVEEILRKALKAHPRDAYDAKSALRDLGCKVELKEEWTGKGGRLTTQERVTDD